jgi:hypothetical protein
MQRNAVFVDPLHVGHRRVIVAEKSGDSVPISLFQPLQLPLPRNLFPKPAIQP